VSYVIVRRVTTVSISRPSFKFVAAHIFLSALETVDNRSAQGQGYVVRSSKVLHSQNYTQFKLIF